MTPVAFFDAVIFFAGVFTAFRVLGIAADVIAPSLRWLRRRFA